VLFNESNIHVPWAIARRSTWSRRILNESQFVNRRKEISEA